MTGGATDPYHIKPRYNSAAEERAHRAVLVAAGQIPFTASRIIVWPSPKGLKRGLIFPVSES